MPKAIVLGAGMVGSVMAADLAAESDFQVCVADLNDGALQAASRRGGGRIQTLRADLADQNIVKKTVQPYDIVLGALASSIGFQTLRTVIEAGKNFCDICFMPQDAWELDALAKSHGVTAVVDCGVAPGMSNMLAGSGVAALDECTNIEIYVGGLPRERRWPFEYKAAFSPFDVIEEYTRPARIVEHGTVVVREALSEPELIDFNGVGTLEAFNTDGLRSLTAFLTAPFMKEKTLRYPGHIDLMRAFRETGLFSHDSVTLKNGVHVRPIDVISALMFPKWSYEPGEEDLTVMRVMVQGMRNNKPVRMQWDMLDYFDRESQTTSMARTTAFPCTAVAKMIARGEFSMPGVIPPELIGRTPGLLQKVLAELAKRRVVFTSMQQ